MAEAPSVTLKQRQGYQFEVQFGAGVPSLLADEPAPLGTGSGLDPSQLLLAAVADCMSSSLLFALGKFQDDPQGITTTARGLIERNAAGRLRVAGIRIEIRIGARASELHHLERVLGQFEEFCTVGQSVRAGIPIDLSVWDGTGARLK